MRSKIGFLLIVFLALGFISPQFSHGATEADDLKAKIEETTRQRDALLEEQRKLQAQLDTLNAQSKTLTGTISSLDATKRKLANDIKLTQNKITAANLNIKSLEGEMSVKEKQILIHRQAITQSLKKLSEYDNTSMVADMLSYYKLSDAWLERETLSSLQNELLTQIDYLRDAKAQLQHQKELKEKNKNDLVSFTNQLGGQKKTVEQTQAAKAKLLAETKSQETAYQKLLADNIARQKAFEAALFEYESQLKIVLDKSAFPSAAPSILGWPLARINITQRFGRTTDSGRLYASGTHNGVDFGTAVGSAVMSVRQGSVWATGNTDEQSGCYSYGRWILVKHDNGLSTLYAHLSSTIVTPGQAVTKGQVIGYSGGAPGAYGSGYSTGPHLHLGLYATQGVRVQKYTSSINCKQVTIPLADPSAYLDPLAYMPAL